MRFCGKKRPLVHRRRRKRRSVHHTAGLDEESGGRLENITVHPTAVKAAVPFLGKRYRIYKETSRAKARKRDRSKSSKVDASAPPAEENPADRAARLARGLTKLIVALPPENQETVPTAAQTTLDRPPKLSNRSQSVESENPSRNPNKHRKQKTLNQMKKLSKSATTLSKSFEKINGEEKKERKRNKTRDKSRARDKTDKIEKPDKPEGTGGEGREVTIAKLGPFKMSLELRDAGNPNKAAAAVEHKPKQSSSTATKHRKRKSSNVDCKEIVRRKSEVKKEPDPSAPGHKQSSSNAVAVTKLKRELSKDRAGDLDKIIVSKLAKSDRPRRDRSPEKRRDSRRSGGGDDYRLSLNKRTDNETSTDTKFKRSISQPNPPPDFSLDELIKPASTGKVGKYQRTLSNTDRITSVNRKQLKRSSTTREQPSSSSLMEEADKSSTLRPSSKPRDVHVFDNLGYDKSPDLRRQRKPSGHSISDLREQLETQLRLEKLRQSNSNYSLMEASSLSDSSDCSERKSPPTQTQSLSEESSTGGGSRRTTRDSFSIESDSEPETLPTGEPQFAANPYVRMPQSVISLQQTGASSLIGIQPCITVHNLIKTYNYLFNYTLS